MASGKVNDVPAKKVSKEGVESQLNRLISDILLSLGDKYLYFSCWLHGDVRQYDVSDPANPKLTGRVQLGGLVLEQDLKTIEDKEGHIIDGSEMKSFNCTFPHTAHCLASGEIMISTMGDKDENGKGDFVLIDAKTLNVTVVSTPRTRQTENVTEPHKWSTRELQQVIDLGPEGYFPLEIRFLNDPKAA